VRNSSPEASAKTSIRVAPKEKQRERKQKRKIVRRFRRTDWSRAPTDSGGVQTAKKGMKCDVVKHGVTTATHLGFGEIKKRKCQERVRDHSGPLVPFRMRGVLLPGDWPRREKKDREKRACKPGRGRRKLTAAILPRRKGKRRKPIEESSQGGTVENVRSSQRN